MISRDFLMMVSLLACLAASADQELVEPRDKLEIRFSQEGEGLLLASAIGPRAVSVEGIRIRNDEHLMDWVLEFRSVARPRAAAMDGTFVGCAVSLNEDDYSQLISALMRELSIEYPEVSISRIQSDMRFVESTWSSVLSSIRAETKDLVGTVEQKDLRVTKAIVDAISNSPQVRITCDALEDYGISCSRPPVTANPVAFRPDAVGESWMSLAKRQDAGLRRDSWFTIRTK